MKTFPWYPCIGIAAIVLSWSVLRFSPVGTHFPGRAHQFRPLHPAPFSTMAPVSTSAPVGTEVSASLPNGVTLWSC